MLTGEEDQVNMNATGTAWKPWGSQVYQDEDPGAWNMK